MKIGLFLIALIAALCAYDTSDENAYSSAGFAFVCAIAIMSMVFLEALPMLR